MKELSIEQMEMVSGGDSCGALNTTAFVIGAVGFSLGIAATIATGGTAAAVIFASQGLMIDAVALGLGAVGLAKC